MASQRLNRILLMIAWALSLNQSWSSRWSQKRQQTQSLKIRNPRRQPKKPQVCLRNRVMFWPCLKTQIQKARRKRAHKAQANQKMMDSQLSRDRNGASSLTKRMPIWQMRAKFHQVIWPQRSRKINQPL